MKYVFDPEVLRAVARTSADIPERSRRNVGHVG